MQRHAQLVFYNGVRMIKWQPVCFKIGHNRGDRGATKANEIRLQVVDVLIAARQSNEVVRHGFAVKQSLDADGKCVDINHYE